MEGARHLHRLKPSLKGCPDHLIGVTRYAKCVPCIKERNLKIGQARLVLTRDPPTSEPMTLPTERQWKDGMKWQRR